MMKIEPFITGTRIYLRRLMPDDANGNYPQWFNDPEVCRYNSHRKFPYTRKKAIEYIQYAQDCNNALILAIITQKDNIHIGNISLQQIDFINRNAEFAIIIGEKEFWNKGFAIEAAHPILEHGFTKLNLHRIYCGTSSQNTGMQKLARKMGMKKEGVRRDAVINNGKLADIIEYGILRPEFLSTDSSKDCNR